MQRRRIVVGAVAPAVGALAVSNASFWRGLRGFLTLLAQRGAHQEAEFSRLAFYDASPTPRGWRGGLTADRS
jgi:hypothetical protein